MSNVVKGEVQVISKRGKAYNIKVDDEWYGFGFESPAFEEGAVIKFNVKKNGKWKNVDNDTLEVLGAGTGKKTVANTSSGSGASREDYWSRKEERDTVVQRQITYQASRNAAINFIELLVKADAVKLPARQNGRVEVLEELLKHYTELFAESTVLYSDEVEVSDEALSQEDESEEEDDDYE